MDIIENHRIELESLCEKYHVAELFVFGSVLKPEFNEESDIDFLVKFKKFEPLEYFDNYFELKEALSNLFMRQIDLVEVQTIQNPILKNSISRTKKIVYGGKDSKVAF